MSSLRFEPWRYLVEANATEIAQALADDLGPIRAREVTVTAGTDGVDVTVVSGERDPIDTVWRVVVELSQLWPVFGPIPLTVHTGTVSVTTDADGMQAVVDGCDRREWNLRSVSTRALGH